MSACYCVGPPGDCPCIRSRQRLEIGSRRAFFHSMDPAGADIESVQAVIERIDECLDKNRPDAENKE